MDNKIRPTTTAGMLRLLAQWLEEDKAPDFSLVIIDEDYTITTAMQSKYNPYGLLGGINTQEFELNDLIYRMKYEEEE